MITIAVIIIGVFSLVCSVILAVGEFLDKSEENKLVKICLAGSIIVAITAFVSPLVVHTVSPPEIDKTEDSSAIVLSVGMWEKCQYRISTGEDNSNEWIPYEEPITLEKPAIVYAQTKILWYRSEREFRDVYVAENGLLYFSEADKPGDSIKDIKANYQYQDVIANKESGNHYVGYKIKKSDIQVTGTTINGDEKAVTDFTYSPEVLKSGKNDITIKYQVSGEAWVTDIIHVIGDPAALVKLEAQYTDSNVYLDTVLDTSNVAVQGTYEDGTRTALTEFSISPIELKEGKNEITISSGQIYDVLELTAVDRESITAMEEEPNDEIDNANPIDVNIKYSGILTDSNDVDYYRLQLEKKGKIILKLTHPKMDDSDTFWIVSLLGEGDDPRVELKSSGDNVETQSSAARVTPGVYYVRVTAANHSDMKYTLTTVFEEEGDSYENEPNDILESQAMTIQLDTEYTGNLTTPNDVDYFKFSTNDKRKIWITFSHNKTNLESTLWTMHLFGNTDDSLLEIRSTGENANITSDSLRLPAGDYYIQINSDYWSDLDYTFCVYSQSEGAETENEDNGDYERATKIDLGSSIIGNMQSSSDIDFYYFDLKNASSIRVDFTHPKIDDTSTFWKLELHSEEEGNVIENIEEKITIYIHGNENLFSEWTSLPAGKYYLKIESGTYNNDDYKITLST